MWKCKCGELLFFLGALWALDALCPEGSFLASHFWRMLLLSLPSVFTSQERTTLTGLGEPRFKTPADSASSSGSDPS